VFTLYPERIKSVNNAGDSYNLNYNRFMLLLSVMYTLGIDTTFHFTGLSIVDKDNKVKFIKSIGIDFSNQNADKFFSSHINNLVALFADIKKSLWDKIDLISVINEEGAFHSVPIGVTAACISGQLKNKRVVGVNHEIAHLYSNWLLRENSQFKFPIVSLSISGAHSAIFLIKDHKSIRKVITILWGGDKNDFSGITALFEIFCHQVGIKIPSAGMGGAILSNLAEKGKDINLPELDKIQMFYEKENVIIFGCKDVGQKICIKYKKELKKKSFQQDLALKFLNKIFGVLGEILLKFAVSTNSKEMHLAGGASANPIFRNILEKLASSSNLVFKAPVKNDFCSDNAAMVAVRGKYKSIFSKGQNTIPIKPSQWYYKYYCENCLQGYKSKYKL